MPSTHSGRCFVASRSAATDVGGSTARSNESGGSVAASLHEPDSMGVWSEMEAAHAAAA